MLACNGGDGRQGACDECHNTNCRQWIECDECGERIDDTYFCIDEMFYCEECMEAKKSYV